jgi:O-antigen/teichoic acid export membrane protein
MYRSEADRVYLPLNIQPVVMSDPVSSVQQQTRRLSPLWLAFWAAADKALPMIYGVSLILIPLRIWAKEEWEIWTIFQMLFMIISMLGDFFILQPMVKIASEHDHDSRPIITAATVLYTIFSLVLALPVVLFSGIIGNILKTPYAAGAFAFMIWMVLSNILRNITIRTLQINYRIIGIFLVDLAYFAGVVGLMVYSAARGEFKSAYDLIHFNLIAFTASSIFGIALANRLVFPTLHEFGASVRRILNLGIHQGGTGILTVLQQQSDLAIVSGVRGGAAAGIYNAARTFYRFYEALRDAAQLLLVPATSRAYSQERIEAVQEVTELATAALVTLLVPMSLALILLAPIISPIILPNYPEAVDEFQWLMATGFVMPFVIVPSAVLLGIGHTRDLFRGTLIGTIVLVGGGLVLTYFFGSTGMAAGVLLGTAVTALFLTRRMDRYVHFTFRSVLRRSRSFGPLVRKRIAAMQIPLRRDSGDSMDSTGDVNASDSVSSQPDSRNKPQQ